jgi:DNA repair protein SbcD/Mre11
VSASFRFVHAADLHLDTPFQGIAGPAPQVAQALRDASLQAWRNLVELTIARQAAFLLLAGDIYDGADRGLRAQLGFLDGLQRLAAAGIRTFIVHGNHDPLDGWSAIRGWPSEVTVFGSDEVACVPVQAGGATVHVHGISYRTRDVRDNLARTFHADPGAALSIGLLHANVAGNAEHAAYAPCSLADLEAAGMHYWALGHVHKRQFLREGGPWVAYAGDTQGRSPKPSELGAKGALVVEVTDGVVQPPEFAPVDVVRFAACEVDIGGLADMPAVQARAAALIDELRRGAHGRALLVRVLLRGRGPAARDLCRADAPAGLRDELRAAFETADPFVWVESVRDQSRGALDLAALRERRDFGAELLHLCEALQAGADGGAGFVAQAAELLAKPGQVEKALRNVEAGASAEELEQALALALDGLEREEGR